MSSFFTTPSSKLERKRPERDGKKSSKTGGHPPARRAPEKIDESISGSDSDDSDAGRENSAESVEDDVSVDEDDAERRRRLAEQYLENIREEIDPTGFDAADIDRDLISQRLKDDVAESKGKAYRHVAQNLQFPATATRFRADQISPTCVAVAYPFVYIAAKDITVSLWKIPGKTEDAEANARPQKSTPGKKPKLVKIFRGYSSRAGDSRYAGHTAPIVCCAVSSSGKYLATGGEDEKIVVWDAKSLKPLRSFQQHRDSVLGLCFQRNTDVMYSASADRTIKTWSLDKMTYVETLFGHEDAIVEIATLAHDTCISVGARDRTARLWKVVTESQLVFRGGSATAGLPYAEGSIDHVAMLDEETFVTGSDNGTISLWNTFRKKPLFSVPLAHGLDAPSSDDVTMTENDSASADPENPRPRWITSLVALPYSDVILSGSWDGHIRAWKVSEDKRRIECAGSVTGHTLNDGTLGPIRGIVNGIAVFEDGDKVGKALYAVVVTSSGHRLGNWESMHRSRCEAVLLEIGKGKASSTANPES
jgi:ribosomal RNA-processing protein 9